MEEGEPVTGGGAGPYTFLDEPIARTVLRLTLTLMIAYVVAATMRVGVGVTCRAGAFAWRMYRRACGIVFRLLLSGINVALALVVSYVLSDIVLRRI